MADFPSIDPSLLQSVSGGEMQLHPGLVGTIDSIARRKKPGPDTSMTRVATALGTAVSDLGRQMSQTRDQSSQAMMQMLPQMMQR
jgi:hypothetical protein